MKTTVWKPSEIWYLPKLEPCIYLPLVYTRTELEEDQENQI